MWSIVLRFIAVLVVAGAFWMPPTQAQAQILPGFGSASVQEDDPDISALIDAATERGVGVIVIDTQGNVLTPLDSPTQNAPQTSIMGGGDLMTIQENTNAFRAALLERLVTLPADMVEIKALLQARSPDGTLWPYGKILIIATLLFAVGMMAEKFFYGPYIAARFVVPMIHETPVGYAQKVPFLTVRFIAGVIGAVFSMMVAYFIGISFNGPIENPAIQYTVSIINVGYLLMRVVALIWRMILSPYLPQYRIPRLDDRAAKRLHLWLCSVVFLGFFTLLFGVWLREMGQSTDANVFFTILFGLGITLLNLALIFANRRNITKAIRGGDTQGPVSFPIRILSQIWAPIAVIYVMFAWGETVYDLVLGYPAGMPLTAAAYIILTAMFLVYGTINYAIERGFERARALQDLNQEPDAEDAPSDTEVMRPDTRLMTFEDLARRVAGILAFVAGGWAFVRFWQPNTDMMMQESLLEKAYTFSVYLFIGYIAYTAFRIWIDAKIRDEQGDEVPGELGDEGGGSSASRLATLLPLFRNFVLIVIVVSMGLILLMELGVNVGPLFAGAGIVGVAVGFGSQSLVRDIFSGAFFLFDDAFRKGEYLDVGGVKGTVENISVRSFQLRHHLGALHTMPFGEIQVLTNYSRDWVIMKLPLRVTYDTDVEKVRKLIKKLGQELLSDPVIGEDFIQPLKSQGVIEMQDSAMIIRVKFMTKPGDQWLARKKVYQEIRALFEREGIKFAHREVTVRLADGDANKDLTQQQKDSVIAAAEAAIEDEDIADAPQSDDR